MSKYFKDMNEAEEEFSEKIKKGVRVYDGVPVDENIYPMDKFVFKNGDLMGEIITDDFPFKLKKDTVFTILSVKSDVMNLIVEIEGPQTYFVKYVTKDFGFMFVVSWNDKANEVITHANINKELLELFKKNNIKKERLIDMAVDCLSKMISIISNDDYCLKHPTKNDVTMRTNNSFKNMGKPILVTTRHTNMIHICDAFPFFYEIDFKKLLKDNPVKEE